MANSNQIPSPQYRPLLLVSLKALQNYAVLGQAWALRNTTEANRGQQRPTEGAVDS